MANPAPSSVKIGRFHVQRRLGRGLQGTVYQAWDEDLHRCVAIKVLHGSTGATVPAQAKNLAKLRHPNIVSLYEAGTHNKLLYLVFELIEGPNLDSVMRQQGRLEAATAVRIMSQVLAGLAHAHAQGIAHLDLSLDNIMLDQDQTPKVMDFDLSGELRNGTESLASTLTGTPVHMAPEHFITRRLDFRSDIYALGTIFYELLTSKPAVSGDDNRSIIQNILYQPIEFAPLELDPALAAYVPLLQKATHRQPERRYADATAMLESLNALQARLNEPDNVSATTGFLLRRLNRRQDFPALSRTLVEINQLTGEGSRSTADQLAKVILRDFAVTNKVLKLANSSFYARQGGPVSSVSDAIKLLGMEQIRLIANSLLCFSAKTDSTAVKAEIRELQTHAFLAGLLSRHLAQIVGLKSGEEAFICGMFHTLGKTLVAYYLPEEYEDIHDRLQSGTASERTVALEILGVSYDDLAIAVARTWALPDRIVATMPDISDTKLPAPTSPQESLHAVAALANALCSLPIRYVPADKPIVLKLLLDNFHNAVPLTLAQTEDLLHAAAEKLTDFAPLLDLDLRNSNLHQLLLAWLSADAEPAEGTLAFSDPTVA